VLTDDLTPTLLDYMPNVQAMQVEGVTFSNYFVAASLCCPSRSSIFTGKYPHNTGVLTNYAPEGGFSQFNARENDAHSLALALQRAGYRTAMLGKYLNEYEPGENGVPVGWNEWDVAGNGYPEFHYALNQNDSLHHYGGDDRSYLTDVLAGLADQFIRQSASRPFFIEIATFTPHRPFVPAPRDRHRFPGLTAPRTPAFAVRPDSAAPSWLREIPPLRRSEVIRINHQYRLRAQSVVAIDSLIGRLRRTLAELGLDQNTYVIFSSDNGFHMGEYSLRPGKMTPYDSDIRVPLIVVGPGVRKGVVLKQIAQNVDLAPTFTEIAGGSAPLTPDGRSLLGLWRRSPLGLGGPSKWRRAALIEHHHPGENPTDPDAPGRHSANPPSYGALRTASFLYVEYEGGDVTYYDLAHDPFELRNIASTLSPGALERLHAALQANMNCTGTRACQDAARQGL
jgi:arylsulfatase A-like enzyme